MKSKWKILAISMVLSAVLLAVVLSVCNRTHKIPCIESEEPLDSQIYEEAYDIDTLLHYMNTISAHDERDTIVGNFTGNGIDTLYVETVDRESERTGQRVTYYMTSSNSLIPKVELYGFVSAPPKLVNEGDLDGNGTCEVGYIHTWMNSQWRYYRIFTMVGSEWRYLVSGDYLDTSEWFRSSGVEVAEPGKLKGTVLVHYLYEDYDEMKGERVTEIRDTIVTPTFDVIDD